MKTHLNPKIYEIALQAGGSHYPEVNSLQLNKFAELLIRQCQLVATQFTNEQQTALTVHAGQCLAAQLIGEYFGIRSDQELCQTEIFK